LPAASFNAIREESGSVSSTDKQNSVAAIALSLAAQRLVRRMTQPRPTPDA
jgi:hypothetical protein